MWAAEREKALGNLEESQNLLQKKRQEKKKMPLPARSSARCTKRAREAAGVKGQPGKRPSERHEEGLTAEMQNSENAM